MAGRQGLTEREGSLGGGMNTPLWGPMGLRGTARGQRSLGGVGSLVRRCLVWFPW